MTIHTEHYYDIHAMKELSKEQLEILSRDPFGPSPLTAESTGIPSLLSGEELSLLMWVRRHLLEMGADECKLSLSKSCSDNVCTLDGEIDQVGHSMDRSLQIAIIKDSKIGSYSTNRLSVEALEEFLERSLESVMMLEGEKENVLPDIEGCSTDAGDPLCMGNADLDTYKGITPEDRIRYAILLSQVASGDPALMGELLPEGFTLVSEEAEYSDRIIDNAVINSRGAAGRRIVTYFADSVSVTLQDPEGNLLSGYAWQGNTIWDKYKAMQPRKDFSIAVQRALDKTGAAPVPSGKYTLVADNSCSYALFSPIINSLSGNALQQKRSFLCDSLGKKVFPSLLTVWDRPHTQGKPSSTPFDANCVKTYDMPIIENGVLKNYYLGTYSSLKLGLKPTFSSIVRNVITPTVSTLEEVSLPSYILVTDFSGGNCNPVTGDFSYGVEGFKVEGGHRTPLSGMLITGNILTLWGNLIHVVDDAPERFNDSVGTLVFEGVDFSGLDYPEGDGEEEGPYVQSE